jgi:hypothetical protein
MINSKWKRWLNFQFSKNIFKHVKDTFTFVFKSQLMNEIFSIKNLKNQQFLSNVKNNFVKTIINLVYKIIFIVILKFIKIKIKIFEYFWWYNCALILFHWFWLNKINEWNFCWILVCIMIISYKSLADLK